MPAINTHGEFTPTPENHITPRPHPNASAVVRDAGKFPGIQSRISQFSDQQFCAVRVDCCWSVSKPQAGGTLPYQVDQAAPENQIIFRRLGKHRQEPDLDRHYRETARIQGGSLHNATDFEL